MITTKTQLNEYIQQDMGFLSKFSRLDRMIAALTCDPAWKINKYVVYLRKEEYYFNTHKNLRYLYYLRKKNRLGNLLGFKIPHNCFGPGLTIYHQGEVIVNESARVGANCRLHGGNCIGNNGKIDKSPVIGDNLDMGIGAKIIGDIHLGDDVKIGAGAIVTRSCEKNGIVLVGVPARIISIDDGVNENG